MRGPTSTAASAPPTGASTDAAPAPSRERVLGQGLTWLSGWTVRFVVLFAGAYLLTLLVELTWSILLPVVLALILTTVLEPPARVLTDRLGLPRALSAGLTILGTLGILGLFAFLFAPSVGTQATEIANSASDGLTRLEGWLLDNDLVTQEQITSVVTAIQDRLQSSASTITTGVLVGVSAVGSILVNLVLTLVLAFFFLKDGHRFLPWLGGVAGRQAGRHLIEVGSRAWETLGGFIRTQALVGLIDAVLIGLALVVVGVPLAFPLAVLTFFAAFAPIIGAVTVGALAVLVALVSNGYVAALIIFASVLVVQQVEGNVLLPWLQGKSLDLHAGVVLLSIVLGSTLFGVTGAFFAVPAVAVSAVVLRYLNEQVLERTDPVGEVSEDAGEPPGTVSDPEIEEELGASHD